MKRDVCLKGALVEVDRYSIRNTKQNSESACKLVHAAQGCKVLTV